MYSAHEKREKEQGISPLGVRIEACILCPFWDNLSIFWNIYVIKDIFAIPVTDVGITVKPCRVCIEAFGEPACNLGKHCSVEDVPGLSPEEALALVVSEATVQHRSI